MLIPIGFLGGGAAAGAYELISTAYGTGSSGTITFSSIPAGYKHLQARIMSRSTDTTDILMTRFNNDTGTNYSWHRLYGSGAAVYSDAFTTQDYGSSFYIPGTAYAANSYGATVVDILDAFSTTKNKTLRGLSGSADLGVHLASGLWRSTSAITSVTFKTYSTGNFTSQTRISLYGIKG